MCQEIQKLKVSMTNLVELIGYVSKHGKPSECPNPRQGLFFVFRYDTIRYYTIRQILRADKNWRLNLPHGTKRKIKLKLEITCHDGKPDGMLRVERRRYGSAPDVSRGEVFRLSWGRTSLDPLDRYTVESAMKSASFASQIVYTYYILKDIIGV